MTTNVGGVEFSIDVDSRGVVTANGQVIESNEDVEKSFNRIDASTKKATSAYANLSKNAGQAGIQLQQFFGQIQGGQSVLLATSQQAADLGIVLGASGLGAAAGIAATALSFLISESGDAQTSLTRLDEIAESVGKTMVQAADGSDVFSESIARLADRSESLARVQIAQTIAELERQISESVGGISDASQSLTGIGFNSLRNQIDEVGLSGQELVDLMEDLSTAVAGNLSGSAVNAADTIATLSRRFDLTTEQAIRLGLAISEFENNEGALGIATLRSAVEDLESELGAGNEKFNEFAAAMLPFFDASRQGVDRINLLRQALGDLDGALDSNSESAKDAAQSSGALNSSLQAQIIALESGAQAAEIYAATQRAIAEGTEDELESVIALINKKYELINARNADAEAARQEIAAQKELDATLTRIFANTENVNNQKREQMAQNLEAIRQGLSTEEQLRAEAYLTEVEQLREAYENGIIPTQQEYNALLEQVARDHQNELIAITDNAATKRMQIEERERQAKLNTVSSTFSNLSALMNTESRKLFEIGKAAAISGAIVDTYAAITKTMASAPYPLNIPLAAAQAAAGFAQVQQIRNTSFGSASTGQSISGGQVVNNVGSTTGAESQEITRNISVGVTGNVDISQLIEEINEAVGDGTTIKLDNG